MNQNSAPQPAVIATGGGNARGSGWDGEQTDHTHQDTDKGMWRWPGRESHRGNVSANRSHLANACVTEQAVLAGEGRH